MIEFTDDLRQTYVIIKHELSKILKGKIALASFSILLVLIIFMFILNYAVVVDYSFDIKTYLDTASMFFTPAIVIITTLVASGMFSSEYETHTGLLMFTKPIRRGSIFAGKVLASLSFTILIVIVYYGMLSLVTLAYTGELSSLILSVMGIMITYAVGVTGITLLLSSIFKKTSISAAASLVLLLAIGQIISFNYQSMNADLWFSMAYSSKSINTLLYDVSGYAIDGFPTAEFAGAAYADPITSVLVMLTWGAFSILYSYAFFSKREF
ncbi:ABC transporter permease [Candidatus Methanomassiliicoccus intestinalis]|uniref:ABC transporter permease n=1 Tax=Candidatus Methanomassiliicoccus intestinalis TaxID=1406512 RepID=UPI0037DDC4A5